MEKRKALAVHNTDITEGEWDGPGAVANMPNDEATLRYCHAWMDPDGDAEAKSTYKFPHHRTKGGPAVLPGVRNALARLPQSNIPEGDKAGVERHLRSHLDKQEEDSFTSDGIERRSFEVVELELRVLDLEGEKPKIEGYAAVFNKRSEVLFGMFQEQIEPGFFAPALKQDVRALWNHNADKPLGRTRAKTLELAEDERGLRVVIDPPDTQTGRDALESIRRGDVTQMSFGFMVKEGGDEWTTEKNGLRLRTLKAGGCDRLFDVSPVTFPAYPQTSAHVRAMLEEDRGRQTTDGGDGQAPGEEETQKAKAQVRRSQRTRKIDLIK